MMDWLNWISGIELRWPWLIFLLPLPWLMTRYFPREQEQVIAPRLPLFETAQSLGLSHAPGGSNKTANWRKLLLMLAWLALVLAICRPVLIGDRVEIPLTGRDLMLAIDISPSMKEQDMTLNQVPETRLTVVKQVVTEFVDKRDGDRIGLILFGSQPYVQSPLTFDTTTVNTLLQEAFLGMAGQSTAIGDAITLGVKRLRQREENSRVLILLSDGANTAGEIPPEKAAQLAAQENIKIYTVGIGAEEMVKRGFFGARRINPSADLDEEMLQQIADLTRGRYFRARNTEELQNIYSAINELEPVEQESRSYRPEKSLYHWFLTAAIICLGIMLIGVIFERIRARLKHPINSVGGKH